MTNAWWMIALECLAQGPHARTHHPGLVAGLVVDAALASPILERWTPTPQEEA